MNKANSFSKEELVTCGHGNLFGANSPRLPIDNMLMIDRITKINDDGGEFGIAGKVRPVVDAWQTGR